MTDVPESAAHAATEVRVVFSRLRRRLREVAKLDELTPSQTSVLSRLDKGGPASSSALAAAEQVRPQSMAATIAAIEQAGLITRTPDPADGRKQLISLSDLGRERIGVSRQAREEWMARALADDFTEDERQTIIAALALLDRLADR
ncbi:MarR family winged helix-turn-helix transcriptional regulator [Paractinoplanes atraurantiacus]|uniref:DNA-binding transcriptional regulator, MarR family n=1 Tax=Paractinoplanes atraurantiacus TaxID=1036182 RepID=A0A285ISB9_9ACTN|nr:MarR family transcriptional regulator [Actinoplanes atraurantiacus]SNY49986.1 DNA-binding transcriptional regulator, MarR family [Actinoplanes atraurantiacus]